MSFWTPCKFFVVLSLIYNVIEIQQAFKRKFTGRFKHMCGECAHCERKEDCGECIYCQVQKLFTIGNSGIAAYIQLSETNSLWRSFHNIKINIWYSNNSYLPGK